MNTPWQTVEPIAEKDLRILRRQMIFDYCKWDPQVGDTSVIGDFPLALRHDVWTEVAASAEILSMELLEAERELTERPECLADLGLPRAIRRIFERRGPTSFGSAAIRLMRFDFHFTSGGWRISEVNSDVPGGFNEASGLGHLMARHYTSARSAGDPAGALAQAILNVTGEGALVALVHATAYTDDRQVMMHLAAEMEARGLRAVLAAPDHLIWKDGQAAIATSRGQEALSCVVRFFPAEWMANLPRKSGWEYLMIGSRTPLCNPGTALLTQSKRLPLVWDRLRSAMATWRRLLPETRDPRDKRVLNSDEWVFKPAFGRVGDSVAMRGVSSEKAWRHLRRAAQWWHASWIAQRRFETTPLEIRGARLYPCLGVYTINAKVVGAYGRVGKTPLIDSNAVDAAVLITNEPECRRACA